MTESQRLPVLALVGRPNVGKSTLFNRLTGTRDALVADLAGLTRDRQYGFAKFEGRRYVVVDELPRNTMGKVQKNVLREEYKDLFA